VVDGTQLRGGRTADGKAPVVGVGPGPSNRQAVSPEATETN